MCAFKGVAQSAHRSIYTRVRDGVRGCVGGGERECGRNERECGCVCGRRDGVWEGVRGCVGGVRGSVGGGERECGRNERECGCVCGRRDGVWEGREHLCNPW